MPITPDTKDWTWVLERPCPECGFQSSDVDLDRLPDLIRALGPPWAEVVRAPGASERTADDRWSVLEYACHVRDVFRKYDGRLALMLERDDPTFPDWDQDASAVDERYAEWSRKQHDPRIARWFGEQEDAAS